MRWEGRGQADTAAAAGAHSRPLTVLPACSAAATLLCQWKFECRGADVWVTTDHSIQLAKMLEGGKCGTMLGDLWVETGCSDL